MMGHPLGNFVGLLRIVLSDAVCGLSMASTLAQAISVNRT
jgi:hypothetical protein